MREYHADSGRREKNMICALRVHPNYVPKVNAERPLLRPGLYSLQVKSDSKTIRRV
jgi:hypothetical protein